MTAPASSSAAEEDLRALARMAALVFERHGAAALRAAAAAGLCGGGGDNEGFRKAFGQLVALGAAISVGVDDARGSGGMQAAQVRDAHAKRMTAPIR